jgi:chromosome segregation ATPase
MPKTWEQLTQTEKIEDLRRDLIKTMERVNQLDRHSDALERGISEIASKLDGLARRVSALEKERK